MDQVSIVSATKRKASHEARRSNVQAHGDPARELMRGDKREITALDRKLVVPLFPNSAELRWGRGFFASLSQDLAKKTRS
jgi:hypothetical protein